MSIASNLRLLGAAMAALVLLLGGCGPGVGGTGTGETGGGLAAFGAQPASVCSGELATLVSCPPAVGTTAPAPGASAVHLADTIDGRQVRVTLQGNTVELSAPCLRVHFQGEWGAVTGQSGRFFGSTDIDGIPTPASLQAQLSGSDVLLTLRDATGRVLLGPVLLRVVAAFAAPACN